MRTLNVAKVFLKWLFFGAAFLESVALVENLSGSVQAVLTMDRPDQRLEDNFLSLLVFMAVADFGPNNYKIQFLRALEQMVATARASGWAIDRLLADKGYDAEWVHRACRQENNIRSFIDPVIHRKDGRVGDAGANIRNATAPGTSASAGKSRAPSAASNGASAMQYARAMATPLL